MSSPYPPHSPKCLVALIPSPPPSLKLRDASVLGVVGLGRAVILLTCVSCIFVCCSEIAQSGASML